MLSRGKYRAKTLKEKLEILWEVDAGKLSKNEITKKHDIPRSTLSAYIRNKTMIEDSYAAETFAKDWKMLRTAKHPDQEAVLLSWMKKKRRQDNPLSGPIIVAKAADFTQRLNVSRLRRFRRMVSPLQGKRHDLVLSSVCGEAKAVDAEACTVWRNGVLLDPLNSIVQQICLRCVCVMVTNVTSLLKTVRAVEDEHARGTRALESTVEAISQEVRAFDSSEPPLRQASPEDLVRATQPVTLATAKAVAAGNSGQQGDVIVAANMGRKAIFDLLSVTKSASCLAETQELKSRVLTSGRECAIRYRELLQLVLEVVHKPTVEGKQALVSTSRNIAAAVTDIVAAAEALKGTDWADPNDPTVIAETELLGAASSIEAAARKLANLQPRRSVKEADESLNFDEMILEAAKSITAATSALVRAASAAQRELVAAGKARLVAAATHSLVESANWLVQGQASEEKLISSAKQVASSTAQLLVACKVKAEPDSSSMRGLQAAGNAVKQATDHLVRAAQRSIAQEQEFRLVINQRMVGGIAQEIGAREEILRKERELEEARERLAQLRRAKYGSAGDGML
ncbi:hypothetical protein HPB49_002151 [Dermacentor silvarum]|uniref:Uncharacterized protein n=1 Tax=Dermacentor silvarum TaxID=543639 RepID=A0ACB8CJA2_DERSI|nr:hypothetical protein HPB49_002151 [Dermacentor silvarum]